MAPTDPLGKQFTSAVSTNTKKILDTIENNLTTYKQEVERQKAEEMNLMKENNLLLGELVKKPNAGGNAVVVNNNTTPETILAPTST
ncbi:MAG: hypothetical protein ACOWWR_13575 [Eubacteriales bacterium]